MKKDQFKKANYNKKQTRSANSVEEAITLLKDTVKGNFDHTFEAQISLKLPEKSKKDSVRFSFVPVAPFTKAVKVLVLADAQSAQDAKNAGADYVGLEDLVEKITAGWKDFDVVIATPTVMPKIAKLGKILGPMGLMPNPRNETVTTDIEKVVKSYKGGKLDYKMAESNQISFKFGKLSQKVEDIMNNYNTAFASLSEELKKYNGNVISKIYVKSTMSNSVRIAKIIN